MRSRNRWLAYTIGQSGMSGRAMTKLCARRMSGCSSDVGSTCTAPGQLLCRGELLQPASTHRGLAQHDHKVGRFQCCWYVRCQSRDARLRL